MRMVKMRQRDFSDCAATCLAAVANYYGLRVPVARVRQLASTDQQGTTLAGMIQAAHALSFDTRAVRGSMTSLSTIPKPAILHVKLPQGLLHFVVLYKVSATDIHVMDPLDGQIHRLTHAALKEIWDGIIILLLPGTEFTPANHGVPLRQRLLAMVRPYTTQLIQCLAGAALYTLCGFSISLFIQAIVDRVLPDHQRTMLVWIGTAMLGIIVFQAIIGAMKNLILTRISQSLDAQLILGYHRHLMRLSQSFFDSMRVGELISRVNDAVKIRAMVSQLTDLTMSFLIVGCALMMMMSINFKLSLMVMMTVPVYAMIYLFVNNINRTLERRFMEQAADLESQLVESIGSVRTIRSLNLSESINWKVSGKLMAVLGTSYRSVVTMIASSTLNDMLGKICVTAVLWAGAQSIMRNEISIGELIAFYTLAIFFSEPLNTILNANKTIQTSIIAAERLFEIVELDPEENRNKIKLQPDMVGDIKVVDVSFRYGAQPRLFEELNILFERGRVTAIVGESGCGKSSIISMLLNLYPIDSGNIFIGDFDIRYLELHSLRKTIGVVSQHIDMFNATILENIAPAEIEPDMKKIISICSSLGILEMIERLPGGFGASVSDRGLVLSGGQRQRIAIARTMYHDPEIIVFDEATSSLDSLSEEYVLKLISVLRERGKTIILIAHRLSTVKTADMIVVLQAGKVSEQGSHSDLLRSDGHYHALWRKQHPTPEMSDV